ncbi:MAG TPA: hypothetical protein VJB94_00670 [Candidatus Nanoarchaeia archaeon]|nr:hypothetical protein [Candidatus Nanoarchaeia archaeon]
MITTIQVHDELKKSLEKLKQSKKDSYEEVIVRLVREIEKIRRLNKKLMIEGAKEMAEESLKITKEWEAIDMEWPEWK